ncbi:MAG: hypothetical protein BMS9Abin34_432 [Patescibacteria group bacterium]|nr:MAG: hypothetical protein BMS9Abin34_432 [Patescibacteria group bacterium]
MKILDLGCGKRKMSGAVGIDSNPRSDADVIHDLNEFPYPFEDGEFNRVVALNILEHLKEPLRVMEELHRICKSGAAVHIEVPHYSSVDFYTDPTHEHPFATRSFDYLVKGNPLFDFRYSDAEFAKREVRITFSESDWGPLAKLLETAVNQFPLFYETHLAFILTAHKVIFDLEVRKAHQ